MVVRWSSTCMMLVRAVQLRPFMENFIFELARSESDKNKSKKLYDLILTDDEWDRVELMKKILACASRSQQAFSSDTHPTLAKAIPAIEGLHRSWEKRSTDDRYAPFHHALLAGMDKINKYYERTEDSDAYIFSMILDPAQDMAEEIFSRRWKDLSGELR
ncbi:hypothetical protein BD410DRAFT_259567 [Rickenella mellea]|uniref:hAT-like transposase RNase-H fold domain-containing protein n=1 Tax=Rickenella mellea TaxID=50990 RepID=A0A4Y7Q6F0_9AGAM|nr:hypothetical protein BD410DRAFT_259567 [Rickenella mellea]